MTDFASFAEVQFPGLMDSLKGSPDHDWSAAEAAIREDAFLLEEGTLSPEPDAEGLALRELDDILLSEEDVEAMRSAVERAVSLLEEERIIENRVLDEAESLLPRFTVLLQRTVTGGDLREVGL